MPCLSYVAKTVLWSAPMPHWRQCLLLLACLALASCAGYRQQRKVTQDLYQQLESSEFAIAAVHWVPQDPARPAVQEAEKKQDPWQPPTPNPKDFDWIKLVSGEWLKGDLKTYRDKNFEFDSDELNYLYLDWGDVVEIRSPRQNTVVIIGLGVHTGTLLMREGKIIIGSADGSHEYKRDEILSIVPGQQDEADYWSGKVSFGLTSQSGNTKQTTETTQIGVIRRSPYARVTLDYLGNYSETDGDKTVDNNRLNGRWDLYISEKWFLIPMSFGLYSDEFQNIDYQFTPGVGFGYHLMDTADVDWDIALTGGWRYTRYKDTQPGEDDDDSSAFLGPIINLDWDITDDIELDLDYSLATDPADTSSTDQHMVATLSVDLWKDLDLDVTFQWDRIGNPQRDNNGVTPDNDDFRWTVGLGWEF